MRERGLGGCWVVGPRLSKVNKLNKQVVQAFCSSTFRGPWPARAGHSVVYPVVPCRRSPRRSNLVSMIANPSFPSIFRFAWLISQAHTCVYLGSQLTHNHMLLHALATASLHAGRDFARHDLTSERRFEATGTIHLAWHNKDPSTERVGNVGTIAPSFRIVNPRGGRD